VTLDFVRFENHGSSRTIWPDVSSIDSHSLAVDGAKVRAPLRRRVTQRMATSRPPVMNAATHQRYATRV
jgi:hypothetical protein